MRPQKHSHGSQLALALIGIVLAGCGTAASPATQPTTQPTLESPLATAAPTPPYALRSGPLPAGEYRTTAFMPPVTFTLVDGWHGLFPDEDDEVALEGPDGAFFAISRVTKVIDPTTFLPVPAPDDLVAWFTNHPGLTVTAPKAVTIGGVSATVLEVAVTDGSATEILAFPAGNLRLPEGVASRWYVVPLGGPDMTIVFAAPDDGFVSASKAFQPVLDSMVISGS